MAVIGATGLEPVNILGSYVQGMELGRANRLAQQQQAAQIEAARQEAELRNYLSTADLESPEAQNQLLRFGAPGATLAKTLGEMRSADLTRQKTMTEIEAAGFKRQRDLLAAVNDQSTYDTWRQGALKTYSGVPNAEQLIPAQFSPQTKERLLLTADQIVERMPMSPEKLGQQRELRAAGAPQISLGPQEKAEKGAFGTLLVDNFKDIQARARSGQQFLPSLETASRVLEQGLQTGFGETFKKDAARVLVGLGLGSEEAQRNVENAQLFTAAVKNQVLQKLAEQKGPQTDQDAARAEETIAGMDKETDVNKFLIDLQKTIIKQDVAKEKFFSNWRRENGSFDGAEEAWQEGPGAKSVFDDPLMKKHTRKAGEVPPPPPGFQINPSR
jgi:hypothetical protein